MRPGTSLPPRARRARWSPAPLRPACWRRTASTKRPVRVLCAGFLGELQNGDAHWRQLDDLRPIRGRGLAQRHEQRGRPAGARHLLQDRLHARGLGVQADQQGRRRGGRDLAREPERRPDDLGRPRLGALPADAWSDLRELPRFRRHPCNRPLAARRRRRTTGRPRASTSTGHLRRARPSRATSATRTPGESAPTARRRAASSTAGSTTSGSTTALSAPARSRPTWPPVQPDPSPPTVISLAPADGATGVNVGSPVTARFSEPMQPASVNTSTFKVKDPAGNTVPATVTYDAATNAGTLKPQVALLYGQTYRALLPRPGESTICSGKALPPMRAGRSRPRPRRRHCSSSPRAPIRSRCTSEILRNGGPRRVHDARRRACLRRPCSATSTSSCSGTSP